MNTDAPLAARQTPDLADPEAANAYAAASHDRSDALERDIPERERSLPQLLARRAKMLPDLPLIAGWNYLPYHRDVSAPLASGLELPPDY